MANEGMLLEIANAVEEFGKRLAMIAKAHGVARATPLPPPAEVASPSPVPQPHVARPPVHRPPQPPRRPGA